MRTLIETLEAEGHNNHAKVWRFADAPPELRALSQAGGDEDWLALVPDWMTEDYYIPWLDSLGTCSVDAHLTAGAIVYIGRHA